MATKGKGKVVFEEYLTNTRATHSKFYEVKVIEHASNKFETTTRHGRMGSSGRVISKGTRAYKNSALAEAERLVTSKIGRGYEKSKNSNTYGGTKAKASTTVEKQALDRFADLDW
jgi:predicted DNA-binding WGR domain protein